MEKIRLDCICWLFEIIEREFNHELLLPVKNLQELGASHFPYIVHVLACPLPSEVVKGEHFVIMDLLKLLPRGSSQVEVAPEPLVQPYHIPMVV